MAKKRRKRKTAYRPPKVERAAPPTAALPGTGAKVEELTRRVWAGEKIHATGDVRSDPSRRLEFVRARNGTDVCQGRTVDVVADPGDRIECLPDRNAGGNKDDRTRRIPMAALTLPEAAARFGARLRQLRMDGGLSMRDLSAVSGVSIATLSRVETGERPLTSLFTLWALADALRVTIDDLVGRKPLR